MSRKRARVHKKTWVCALGILALASASEIIYAAPNVCERRELSVSALNRALSMEVELTTLKLLPAQGGGEKAKRYLMAELSAEIEGSKSALVLLENPMLNAAR